MEKVTATIIYTDDEISIVSADHGLLIRNNAFFETVCGYWQCKGCQHRAVFRDRVEHSVDCKELIQMKSLATTAT